jgi:hypothetical protein
MYLLIGLIGAGVVLGLKIKAAPYAMPSLDDLLYWPKTLGLFVLHVLFWPVFLVCMIVNGLDEAI